MKQSEFIITAVLVLAAFVFGFYNITNTAPTINNSQMNTSVSIESSNTNEEVNLQIIPYMTETIEEEVIIEMDTTMSDSTLEVSSDSLRIKGISTTALGDILIGAASDAGYTRLAAPSISSPTTATLQINHAGVVSWTTTIDGGEFS